MAKAREIAKKAEAEGRAKAREVADAMKAHRHDDFVWQWAKEEFGGELSPSGSPSKSRQLSFKGMGGQVAVRMMPDGTKALAPSGAAVVGQEFTADPVALGQVATGLLDVLLTKQHTSAEYAYLAQTTRTNNAAVVGVRPAESMEFGTRHGASQP